MFRAKKYYINAEKGIALVAALLACLILLALGAVVITLSTGDIGTSSRLVGNKRAVMAAEKGIARLTQNFDPANPAASAGNTNTADLAVDPQSQYTISTPVVPAIGPKTIAYGSRYQIMGRQNFGMVRYNANVTGQNTAYNTRVTIGVGIGWGPVSLTP